MGAMVSTCVCASGLVSEESAHPPPAPADLVAAAQPADLKGDTDDKIAESTPAAPSQGAKGAGVISPPQAARQPLAPISPAASRSTPARVRLIELESSCSVRSTSARGIDRREKEEAAEGATAEVEPGEMRSAANEVSEVAAREASRQSGLTG